MHFLAALFVSVVIFFAIVYFVAGAVSGLTIFSKKKAKVEPPTEED